jgi:hypothetical protein
MEKGKGGDIWEADVNISLPVKIPVTKNNVLTS